MGCKLGFCDEFNRLHQVLLLVALVWGVVKSEHHSLCAWCPVDNSTTHDSNKLQLDNTTGSFVPRLQREDNTSKTIPTYPNPRFFWWRYMRAPPSSLGRRGDLFVLHFLPCMFVAFTLRYVFPSPTEGTSIAHQEVAARKLCNRNRFWKFPNNFCD